MLSSEVGTPVWEEVEVVDEEPIVGDGEESVEGDEGDEEEGVSPGSGGEGEEGDEIVGEEDS